MPDNPLSALLQSPGEIRIVLVVAHPDDETLGASSLLTSCRDILVVHVTDGSPANLYDALRYGFHTCEEYAATRRQELHSAMEILSPRGASCQALTIPDQQASFYLRQVVDDIRPLLEGADLVFTHPYEGGHPDHDATAFAVHMAVRSMPCPPVLGEFTSYHDAEGCIRTGEFLPPAGEIVELDVDTARKKRALDAFRTQAETLSQFPVGPERFRIAPRYDFTAPPHAGTLFYERFDWGMTPARFLALTAEAMRESGASQAA